MERARRGWNGTLLVSGSTVVIRRGLRGLLIRKQRDRGVEVPFDRIGVVRYAPSRRVVGYVQLVERGSVSTDDYLQTIRDPYTVTFASRSERWRSLAQDIATRSGARLEITSAAPYWGTVLGSIGGRRTALPRLIVHFGAIPIALLVGLIFHSATAFAATMAIALVVSFALRRTVLR
ncbi:MAG TPA: DUF4429 domain-containing protein [Gaiellaceae bacterium]|nr:DUF4429 domain-containing protein [Gaiellaceae bacterium]